MRVVYFTDFSLTADSVGLIQNAISAAIASAIDNDLQGVLDPDPNDTVESILTGAVIDHNRIATANKHLFHLYSSDVTVLYGLTLHVYEYTGEWHSEGNQLLCADIKNFPHLNGNDIFRLCRDVENIYTTAYTTAEYLEFATSNPWNKQVALLAAIPVDDTNANSMYRMYQVYTNPTDTTTLVSYNNSKMMDTLAETIGIDFNAMATDITAKLKRRTFHIVK